LQIAVPTVADGVLTAKLFNNSSSTRVHVLTSRLVESEGLPHVMESALARIPGKQVYKLCIRKFPALRQEISLSDIGIGDLFNLIYFGG